MKAYLQAEEKVDATGPPENTPQSNIQKETQNVEEGKYFKYNSEAELASQTDILPAINKGASDISRQCSSSSEICTVC